MKSDITGLNITIPKNSAATRISIEPKSAVIGFFLRKESAATKS